MELLSLRKQDVPILSENFTYTYTGPDIQNQILEVISSEITSIIVEECKDKPFSIIADETPDVSNDEQVAIIIGYVSDSLEIIERFVRLSKIESTTGAELEKLILSVLKGLGLSSESFLVAQGYDGGSNMSGEFKGVASRIRKNIPRAMYVNCHCHKLNLALSDALNLLTSARNCLGTVNSLYTFIEGSAKRHAIFLNSQLTNKATTVKRVDGTRWSSRERAVTSLVETYVFVLDTLSYISYTDNSESGAMSKSLLKAIEEFEFQFMLRLLDLVFERVGILSDALQSPEIEMDRCSRLLQTTLESLAELLNDDAFNILYEESIAFAKENSMGQPKLPRRTRIPNKFKDTLKECETFASTEERFKSIYYETITKVIDEISTRFENESLAPLLQIERILKGTSEENDLISISKLNYYNNMIKFDHLKAELISWKQYLKIRSNDRKYDLSTISDISRLIRDEKLIRDYPNLEFLLRIYLTIPITSVSAERSFSALKRIKTYLRNTIRQTRLTSLALIHIEKELSNSLDFNKLIDKFASIINRRMYFF